VEINLEIGDIVIDVATNDIGLLISRYSLSGETVKVNLWAWEIYWTGSNQDLKVIRNRYQPYTEEGLCNLIRTGTFIVEKRS
tara:strand:- start:204 stop:449 length:246 start_codon:yes stop_codon:yes gene_type:complete